MFKDRQRDPCEKFYSYLGSSSYSEVHLRLIEGFLDWERRKVGAHIGPHDDRVEVHDHFFRRLVELKID